MEPVAARLERATARMIDMATPYTSSLDADDVRAYADRDWAAVEHSRRAYWADRFRECGSDATVTAGWALLDHLRAVHAEDPAARERDLAHHVEFNRWLDRTAHAGARR